MNYIKLSRSQYDYLVTNCPNWMEANWSRYSKQWSIGGVTLCGSHSDIDNLTHQLQ